MSRRGENVKPSDAWKAKQAEITEKRKRTAAAQRIVAAKEREEPALIRERAQEQLEAFWEREAKRARRRRDPRARRRAKSAYMQTAP